MRSLFHAAAAALALGALGTAARAAEPDPRPAFNVLRFEEDWSHFSTEQAQSKLDKMKHVQLNDDIWVSFGGRLRLRYEDWNNNNFTPADDGIVYYRAFAHSDWHFGEHMRVFVEGRFTDSSQRSLPLHKREQLDYDRMDLWNTFVEGDFKTEKANIMFRAGRQELLFGKQRLVGPLDWSNNRRIFDAVRLRVSDPGKKWQVDAFTSMPVTIDGDWFTWNDTDDTRLFSGVYYTQKLGDKHTLEAYALALNHVQQVPIADDRYTLGVRGYGPVIENLTFDVEGGVQLGNREVANLTHGTHQDIWSWYATAELLYTFNQVDWKPYLGVGFDYASGDHNPADDATNTFNQLFPTGHLYFGYIDAVGRQNIIDANATFGAWPVPKKVNVKLDTHFFWLAEMDDGLYNAGGALLRGAKYTTPGGQVLFARDRHVGAEIDLTVQYIVNRYFALQAGYSRFFAGNFLDKSGMDRNTDFVYAQAEFTF